MARVLSGIQPSGDVHLGNYVGALRNWVDFQNTHDAFYCIVDLHALTLPWEPAQLTAKTLQTAQILMASGIDPDISKAYAQLQARRIASVRGLSLETVQQLIADNTHGRSWGFFGEPGVNVLELNLALDRQAP